MNHGPIDLQSIALPLSYTPSLISELNCKAQIQRSLATCTKSRKENPTELKLLQSLVMCSSLSAYAANSSWPNAFFKSCCMPKQCMTAITCKGAYS